MDESILSPLRQRENDRYLLKSFAIFLIIVGVLIIIFFIPNLTESKEYLQGFGSIGDYISGVAGTSFSLAGFFLLYLTLKDQRENFHRERLESNYFEMIAFHRENVNELKFTYCDSPQDRKFATAEKRKVFKLIFTQFKEAWRELDHFFRNTNIDEIYSRSYLESLKNNQSVLERNIDLRQYAQIDIIYTIIFFGLSQEDREIIFSVLSKKYKQNFIENIIAFAILKPKLESNFYCKWEWLNGYSNRIEIFNDIVKQRTDKSFISNLIVQKRIGDEIVEFDHFYSDSYPKYYGGHQFRLGHYYRHLFQTIKFIDGEKYLTFREKYGYIKILRGQLSNFEQTLFFLNSISGIGRSWELEEKKCPQFAIQANSRLVTKYNLIKNIPIEIILGEIVIKNYYPNVTFEIIDNPLGESKREEIEKQYS